MTVTRQPQHRLTNNNNSNGVAVAFLVMALGSVLLQGCVLTPPPEAKTVTMDRDQVVTTLVEAWAPNGWAVTVDTPYSVTFERMPTADEAFQVGQKPLRIIVTITGRMVRARCYIGNQDSSTGRWAQRVQADFDRLLR